MTERNDTSSESDNASELSGALQISTLPVPGAGSIGITHCPGRRHVDAHGRPWRRSLQVDLAAITSWGAVAIVSLVESQEFAQLGVPDFSNQVRASGLRWFHMAIPNMSPPGTPFNQAWMAHGHDILEILAKGDRLIVHCAGGLGRTGMIAAKLMTTFGMPPEDAMRLVRKHRPGSIETIEQEQFVLNGPPLSRHRR